MKPLVRSKKISSPHFTNIVNRPHLLNLIENNKNKKLILIIGRIAQRRTTLVASYIKISKIPSVWVELDKDGSDSFTLFPLIVQSLRRNLFVQSIYDEIKGWLFRYHKWFRDFLKTKFESEIGDKECNKKLREEIEENGFAFISLWIYELSGYLMFSRGEFQESIEITKKPFFVLTMGNNSI